MQTVKRTDGHRTGLRAGRVLRLRNVVDRPRRRPFADLRRFQQRFGKRVRFQSILISCHPAIDLTGDVLEVVFVGSAVEVVDLPEVASRTARYTRLLNQLRHRLKEHIAGVQMAYLIKGMRRDMSKDDCLAQGITPEQYASLMQWADANKQAQDEGAAK